MGKIKALTQSQLDSLYAKYKKYVQDLDAKGYVVEEKEKQKFKLMYDQERYKAAREGDKKKSVLRLVVRKSIMINKKQDKKLRKYFDEHEISTEKMDNNLRKEFFNRLLEDELDKEGVTEAEAYSAAGAAYNEVF